MIIICSIGPTERRTSICRTTSRTWFVALARSVVVWEVDASFRTDRPAHQVVGCREDPRRAGFFFFFWIHVSISDFHVSNIDVCSSHVTRNKADLILNPPPLGNYMFFPQTTETNVCRKKVRVGTGQYIKWIEGLALGKNALESTSYL